MPNNWFGDVLQHFKEHWEVRVTDGVNKPQVRIPKSQLTLQILRGANLQVN